MQKIKNLAKENEEVKTQISQLKTQRTEAKDAMKAKISNKPTSNKIKDNNNPIRQSMM